MLSSYALTPDSISKAVEKLRSLSVPAVDGFYELRIHPVTKRAWEMRESLCKTDNRLHWRQIHDQACAEVEGWA